MSIETIPLGPTGRSTTRLGFGGSSLMGALGKRASLASLEAAYDAGIRHFDVAPIYGYGEAEACLGEFLARHPSDITIATKYGIPPVRARAFFSLARSIAGPIIRQFPAVKKRLASVAQTAVGAAGTAPKATFTAEQAKTSLESSLAALKTGHIDVWLLHEVTAQDLTDERLLRLLEDMVREGKIGAFGIGSEAAKVPQLLEEHPEYCPVLQYEWSVLDPKIAPSPSFRIHHRALTNNFRSLHQTLTADPARCRRWSERAGADLADPHTLARLMLKASLVMNPGSVILFSSKQPQHIHANASVASDPTLDAPAERLYQCVQEDLAEITTSN